MRTLSFAGALALAAARVDPFELIPLQQLARRVGASEPEQIWLALGATQDAVTVTWVTANSGSDNTVSYGTSPSFGSTATATTSSYTYGSYTSGEIHTATLTGLKAATQYYYRVGGTSSGWSATMSFTSNRVGPQYP
jgi:hypothetical protein